MAQSHRRTLTRDDLLHRYASAMGTTYGEARDLHADSELHMLRDLVDTLERTRADERPGRRRTFARSQPTTSIDGQTR